MQPTPARSFPALPLLRAIAAPVLIAAFLLSADSARCETNGRKPSMPNIVLILVDDMG